jgi:hypothetical protein
MNTTKSIFKPIIVCMLVWFTLPAANAQDALKQSTPEQRAQLQTGMMKTKLKLDSTQAKKVQAINLKYAQQLDPIIKSDSRSFKTLMRARSIQKDKDAELRTTLNEAQYKQYDDMKDEMKEKVKNIKQKN